jgi:hypothetical protein
MIQLKEIPFLYMPEQPSRHDIQKKTEEANINFSVVSFARGIVNEFVTDWLRRRLYTPGVCYVSQGELIAKSKQVGFENVYVHTPALQHNYQDLLTRFDGKQQFNFGCYRPPDKLLLVEDVIEWSDHRRDWLKVRTAEDLIQELRLVKQETTGDSYWYVYRHGNSAPRVRHSSLKAAVAEAERLAVKHPGAVFEILQAVAVSQVTGPASTRYMSGVIPVTKP